MAEWYYDDNGMARGPVAEADLNAMLAHHLIRPDVKVWTASFGSVWKSAAETQLEAAAVLKRPPPLSKGVGAVRGHSPTKVPPTDDYAKCLAHLPLLALAIDVALFAAGIDIEAGSFSAVSPLVLLLGSIIFAGLDSQNIERSWRNPKGAPLGVFISLTPVGYFWRRAVIAGQSFGYLSIWFACLIAWAVGIALMIPD